MHKIRFYFLDGKEPVPTSDLNRSEQDIGRRVALTEVNGVRVSTVFIAIDHNYYGPSPRLFETMIFGGPRNREIRRYSTWDEAEKGHEEMVKLVKGDMRT